MFFSGKYNRGHGGFKVIIYGVYGLLIIEYRTTTSTFKMEEIGRKTLVVHALGNNFFKEEV